MRELIKKKWIRILLGIFIYIIICIGFSILFNDYSYGIIYGMLFATFIEKWLKMLEKKFGES